MNKNTSNPQPELNEIVIAPPADGQKISLRKLLEGKQGLFSKAKPIDKITFEDGLYILSEPLVIDRPITLVAKNPAKAILKNEVISNLITFTGEGKLVLTGIVFMLGNPKIKTNVIIMKSGTLEMSMCGVGGGFDPDFGKRDFGAGLLLLGNASASVANTYFTMNLLGVSLQGSSNAALVKNTFGKNRYGVVLRDKANGNLQSNEFKENFETGVMAYDQAVLTSNGDSSHNNKQGIGFLFNAKATIENTACYENEYHGFFINDSSQVTLKGCKSYSNAYSGIAIYGDSHSEIQDCECYKNALSGFEIAEQAITLLKHNRIYKNKDSGVHMRFTAKAKILESEIFENNTGLSLLGFNTVTIEKCQIHHNATYLIDRASALYEIENEVFDNPPGAKAPKNVDKGNDVSGDESHEEMLRRLAASGNLSIHQTDIDGEEKDIIVDPGSLERFLGVPGVSNAIDDEEDDDDSSDQEFSIGFGFGSDGSITRLDDDGHGGLSFTFTLDEDDDGDEEDQWDS